MVISLIWIRINMNSNMRDLEVLLGLCLDGVEKNRAIWDAFKVAFLEFGNV